MPNRSLILFLVVVAVVTTTIYRVTKQEWVNYREGETLFANGDFVASNRAYSEAWQRGLRTPQLVVHYHESLLKTSQASAAAEIFRSSFQKVFSRELTEALIDQGLRFSQNETLAALAAEWVALHSGNRAGRLMAARLYGRLGRLAEAEREYRNFLGESTP